MKPPRVTVAIPTYNEEEVLPELLRRVTAVVDGLPGGPHQMLYVDDGSRDATVEMLRAAAAKEPRMRVVVLSRNFGHQVAITALLDHAEGDVMVIMDSDLQDVPEAIPALVAKHLEGYEVVQVRRTKRKESWPKRLSYFLYYRLAAMLSDTPLPLDTGDFSLISRPVIEALKRTRERHRYVRGLRSWVGFRQASVVVERAARAAGEPKYSPVKYLKIALDGIFSFSVVPLRLATLVGAATMALSLGYVAYAAWARLVLDQSPRGFTALIAAIVFLAGVQMLFLGVIGEYVGRIYEEVKGRPLYFVREDIGGRPGDAG